MQNEKENKKPEDSKNEKLISLILVVNTVPVTIQMNENAPMKALVERALAETHNAGRAAQDWELKLGDQLLIIDKRIKDYGLKDGQELYLSLKAGAGGSINIK